VAKNVLNAMVSYQTFVKLAFDEAKAKGASFQGIDDGGDFMTQVAELWSKKKDEYKPLTERQVRTRLQKVIEA